MSGSFDKFAESKKSKTKQLLREAEALFAKASLRIEQKDFAGAKFRETLQLLEQAHQKYELALKITSIPSIQIQLLDCLIQWGTILLNQAEELLSVAQKKVDKFSKSNRSNAGKYLSQAIGKYEMVLEIIEKMKDSAAEDSEDYFLNDEETQLLDRHHYSTLLDVGRAQSVRGVSLLTEADVCQDSKVSKAALSDALFLFKQSYNNFADCIAQDPQNHVALRHWGSALCKEAFTLKLLNQVSPDPMKLVVEGGDKLILAYRISPQTEANRKSLSRFFFDQGTYVFQQFGKNTEDKKKLAEADLLLQNALKFSHPKPSRQLLLACSALAKQVSNFIATPALCEHEKLVSEEFSQLADWVKSKTYQNSMDKLRKFNYLTKKGKVVSSWKRRFFVLTGKNLHYYSKAGGKCLGTIPVRDIQSVVEDFTNKDLCFAIDTSNRRYLIQTDDEHQLFEWIDEIQAVLQGQPSPLPSV